jgi:Fe-S-cluster containining protein
MTSKTVKNTKAAASRGRRQAAPPIQVREPAPPSLPSGWTPDAARRLPILSDSRRQVPCLSCALCCTYVAVEIDGPSSVRSATDILWYLYHGRVSIYVDDEGWMVQIDTRCRHLGDDNKCGVYENRPPMCRTYSENTCEVNADEVGITFHTAAEYLEYLQKNHRRIHTLIAKRYVPGADKLQGGPSRKLGPFKPRFDSVRALGSRS